MPIKYYNRIFICLKAYDFVISIKEVIKDEIHYLVFNFIACTVVELGLKSMSHWPEILCVGEKERQRRGEKDKEKWWEGGRKYCVYRGL